MSERSNSRPRREGVKYSTLIKKHVSGNPRLNLTENKRKNSVKATNDPDVFILSKANDKGKNKEVQQEANLEAENNKLKDQQMTIDAENNSEDTRLIQETDSTEDDTSGPRKNNQQKKLFEHEENIDDKDEIESVTSFTSETSNNSKWCKQPTYMHHAQIFKRNPLKENMHGVKLWDIPLGMRYKELETELGNLYGPIEHMNLRVNNMWQSAIVIFKTVEDAKKLLENWSIIIGDDSLRVTPIDQTFDNLKSRGIYAARVINLPVGITARELIPHIAHLGAKTCYFSRTRNYRRRGEAIISFASEEEKNNALKAVWEKGNFDVKIIDIETKTCHRCHSNEHLVASCPRTIRDNEFRQKNNERLSKFGGIYKKHNPKYFAAINKQVGNKTYADVTKGNKQTPEFNRNMTMDRKLNRIEQLLTDLTERLDRLEEF
ncbi:11043_t:CDS:2, partial [Diversispora eburnea]